jgi:hypothetical protein
MNVNAKIVEAAETARRFDVEPDFVGLKSCGFSLSKLLERYPDRVPPHVMAAAMGLLTPEGKPDEAAATKEIKEAVLKLRDLMGLTDEDLVSEEVEISED